MKTLVSACIFILLITGCKKDDTCNLTAESLSGSYKLAGLKYQASASVEVQDLFIGMEDCKKDNLFIFSPDRTFVQQDIGTICLPSHNDQSIWDLDGTTLTVDNMVTNVTSFDCSKMETTTADTRISG